MTPELELGDAAIGVERQMTPELELGSLYQPSLFGAGYIEPAPSDGWCTPEWLLVLVRGFLGAIDLDPCSNDVSTVNATTSYTERDDGLSHPWAGRVFVNPPYSDPEPWMRRCSMVGSAGEVVALPKGDWSTAWWRSYVLTASVRCQLHARVDFVSRRKRTTAPFPSALVYWGPRVLDFGRCFEAVGEIVVKS